MPRSFFPQITYPGQVNINTILLTFWVNSLCGKTLRRCWDHNEQQQQGLLEQPQNYSATNNNSWINNYETTYPAKGGNQ